MEYIPSKDGLYDGQASQVWLYHHELAPKGRRFYTDEPPAGDGWVDTPTKFPGYQAPQDIVTISTGPPKREVPIETFRFHKVHGAKRFTLDDLPSEDSGWFDTPTAAAAWTGAPDVVAPEPEAAPAGIPDPLHFTTVDDYMDEYCRAGIDPDMPPAVKTSVRKEGLERYAMVKYHVSLDRRMRIEELLDRVKTLEA